VSPLVRRERARRARIPPCCCCWTPRVRPPSRVKGSMQKSLVVFVQLRRRDQGKASCRGDFCMVYGTTEIKFLTRISIR
jgi:hypothetical protein